MRTSALERRRRCGRHVGGLLTVTLCARSRARQRMPRVLVHAVAAILAIRLGLLLITWTTGFLDE